MKTNMIDRATLRLLSAEIEAALQAVATKHGVSIKAGRGQYTNGATGSLKLEFGIIDTSGNVASREAEDFKLYAQYDRLIGLKADDLGRTFVSQGKTFTITGYRAKARSKPILAVDQNGAAYVFPTAAVVAALSSTHTSRTRRA